MKITEKEFYYVLFRINEKIYRAWMDEGMYVKRLMTALCEYCFINKVENKDTKILREASIELGTKGFLVFEEE